MKRTPPLALLLALLVLMGMAAGCASTGGSYTTGTGAPLPALTAYTDVRISVTTTKDVTLGDPEKTRIQDLIVTTLKTEAPTRFATINDPAKPECLNVAVMIKRYDEGNAFARAMLAGLGQMHIDADVVLTPSKIPQPLGSYEVTKTFAWGGLYGAGTRITDIEEGFAKAVVAGLLGK